MTVFRSTVAAIVLLLTAAPVLAQPAAIPRTADGHADFHGVWTTRFPPFLFQRAKGAETLVVDDKTAHAIILAIYKSDQAEPVFDPGDDLATIYALPKVNGEWRTSMLTSPADGKAPLTDEAQRLDKASGEMFEASPDGHEMRDWSERCLLGSGGAPFGMFPTENIRKFIQTPENLVIYSDDLGEARLIGIGAARRPAAIVSFLGDSIARWEGDVLVVETTGIRGERTERALLPGLMVATSSRVIERFSFIDPDELLYQFTVDDPVLYSAPWSAEYSMVRQNLTTYENACHEGNYALTNILRIARNRDGNPVKR